MTTVIDPPLLTKKKSYEQWKDETLAWTEFTWSRGQMEISGLFGEFVAPPEREIWLLS